jgi:hypothetical protein
MQAEWKDIALLLRESSIECVAVQTPQIPHSADGLVSSDRSVLGIDHTNRFFGLDSAPGLSHDESSSHLLRGKSRELAFCLPAVSAALQIS